ncbi:arrestin domain-containing protein 2-like [Dunckerocampus dactyliophorus]|uniref:arrestin domain-containing protein 2-like n=1 Tax=Dunckerocampus dactyliophorus TaxID=161453 RepID=UPI002406A341|nr:arrestin domain-containing protein 2-like [Dunckerocampus dactyliophorus]
MPITAFFIEYDALDVQHSFTDGDTINGRIFVEALMESEIQSITFFAKGKERFDLSTHDSNFYTNYPSKETFYNVKQDILKTGPQIIGEGRHVFPFSFKTPDREITASPHWVQYKLKAKLKQPMKRERTVETYFIFFPKESMDIPPPMEPQYVHIQKKVLGSGTVTMDVYTQRMSYKPGEALQVTAEINNKSSHSVKPTYVLYWKQNWAFPGQRIIYVFPILEKKAKPVAAHSRKTVTKVITIPRGIPPSISIRPELNNEYILKVSLDMMGTNVTKVKLPLFVLSDSIASQQQQSLNALDLAFHGEQPKKKSRSIDNPIDFKEMEKEMYLSDG